MRVESTQSIRSRLSVALCETVPVTRSAPFHRARRPLVTVSPFNRHVFCVFVVPSEEKGARPTLGEQSLRRCGQGRTGHIGCVVDYEVYIDGTASQQ
jgi:hypothetical protein